MTQYKNISSDVLTFTLGDGSEYQIAPGQVVGLPASNDYIQGLVGQEYLIEVSKPSKTTDK